METEIRCEICWFWFEFCFHPVLHRAGRTYLKCRTCSFLVKAMYKWRRGLCNLWAGLGETMPQWQCILMAIWLACADALACMCAGYAPQDAESLEPGGVTCLADMLYEGKAGSDTWILLLLAYACVLFISGHSVSSKLSSMATTPLMHRSSRVFMCNVVWCAQTSKRSMISQSTIRLFTWPKIPLKIMGHM